jgi:hypothetical protein
MTPEDSVVVICRDCGALARAGETTCFLCGRRLGAVDAAKETPQLAAVVRPTLRPTYHMSSFLLLIAVVAVCLGAGRDQPVLGIALAVVVVPAAAYTTIVAFRSAGTGRPMSVFEKIGSFAGAITGVLAIEFAALVTFCMTCIPAGFVTASAGEPGIIVAIVIGGTAAVAAAAAMTRYLLTRKSRLARKGRKP